MTRDERVREYTLLKHRWTLIKSGFPKQAIKISIPKIFVNNVEYGSFSQSGFVLASARPEALSTTGNDHPNNHDPQTLCKGTSSTTQSASHVSPFTPVSQPTIANDPMLHISHNSLSPSSANVPISSSPDHSNLSSPSQCTPPPSNLMYVCTISVALSTNYPISSPLCIALSLMCFV